MSEFLPVRPDEPSRYDATFIGKGFSWPLTVDHTGSIRLTSGPEDIDRSIRIILMTAPSERVMRPRFGCEIWDLVFEPVTPSLFGLIVDAVERALGQWEPRIDVENVDAVEDPDDSSLIRVHISYRIKATNDHRNLVYPFYVIPHEEE